MAAPPKTIQKPATTPTTPKTAPAPKSEKELRAAFGTSTTKVLKALARAANRAERIMRKNVASEAQLDVFRKGVETYTGRIIRAARGETNAEGITVPQE